MIEQLAAPLAAQIPALLIGARRRPKEGGNSRALSEKVINQLRLCAVISKGERNVEVLKQPVNSPLPVDSQVAMIYAGTENLLRNVPIDKVKEFQKEYVAFLRSKHPETMAAIKAGKIDDQITGVLKQAASELASKYN